MIIVHHLDREQAKSRECPAYDTLARTDGSVEPNDCHIMSPTQPERRHAGAT